MKTFYFFSSWWFYMCYSPSFLLFARLVLFFLTPQLAFLSDDFVFFQLASSGCPIWLAARTTLVFWPCRVTQWVRQSVQSFLFLAFYICYRTCFSTLAFAFLFDDFVDRLLRGWLFHMLFLRPVKSRSFVIFGYILRCLGLHRILRWEP